MAKLRSMDVSLWTEGDKLRYKAPAGTMNPALLKELAANKAEILKVLSETVEAASWESMPISTVARDGDLLLSFAQQRLWFLHQLSPDSAAYNIRLALEITGLLDLHVLEKSINEIVDRHEVLRTRFPVINGTAKQIITPVLKIGLPVVDLQHLNEKEQQAAVQRHAEEDAGRPFDLMNGPLIRVTVLRTGTEDQVLLLSMHHIISDGWSMDIFFRELTVLYEAFSQGKDSPLEKSPLQYADYAAWQSQWLQGSVMERQLTYWQEKLANLPTLDLVTDHPRPSIQTYEGSRETLLLPKEQSQKIEQLGRQAGTSLFMTLLAAFNVLLHRYTSQEDIVVGSPIANHNRAEIEGLIGFFVNTLVMRNDLSGNPSFKELLARVRDTAFGTYQHQDISFESLVEALKPERDLSRTPLFQIIFALQNAPMAPLALGDLTISPVEIEIVKTRFDLEVHVWQQQQGLNICLIYNKALFEAGTIRRMIGHFKEILTWIPVDPDMKISALPMMTEDEMNQVVVKVNRNSSNYPRHLTIHGLFEQQAAETPETVALECEDRTLTYGQLNNRANQLAHYLLRHGVGPETRVGICMDRGLEMVVGILAILKAGGVYVPLDPDYPEPRLQFMLHDTAAPVLLTQAPLKGRLSEYNGFTVCLDAACDTTTNESNENPVSKTAAGNLAYIMYTSGSTGQPKGVCIEHRSVVRLVRETNYVELGHREVFLQFAPISFDASTFELWGSLLNGAKLVIFPPHKPSLHELADFIQKQQITTIWLTAALFHQMVDTHLDSLLHVKQVLAGGETLSVAHVRKMIRALGDRRLINGYGPTENTTFTACHVIKQPGDIGRSVPIGVPVSNTQIYILDQNLQPVPVGIPGELYTGGDGLARQYLNQPTLTAERFVPDPFSGTAGARLYRTGDRTRYLENGTIEFLGRMDDQVKIRGFRIEPGEIEAVITLHPGVKEAVVLCREDMPGDKRLAAYLVVNQEQIPAMSEVRGFLQQKLPAYMVPAVYVILEMLPLTPNGKVDQQALPLPDDSRVGLRDEYIAPRTPTEQQLARIWSEILGVKEIGIHDNFFDLGGHSLMATQLVSRLRSAFEVEVLLSWIFEKPTVLEIAEQVDGMLLAISSLDTDRPEYALDRTEGEL